MLWTRSNANCRKSKYSVTSKGKEVLVVLMTSWHGYDSIGFAYEAFVLKGARADNCNGGHLKACL